MAQPSASEACIANLGVVSTRPQLGHNLLLLPAYPELLLAASSRGAANLLQRAVDLVLVLQLQLLDKQRKTRGS